jgi:hypothetical protein
MRDNPDYFNDEGKQLKPYPAHWMTVPVRLKVGSRGPEFKDWDQVVTVLETHNGRGPYPSRNITQDDDEDTVWAAQTAGYLVVSLPYPYSYRRRNEDGTYEDGTYKTIASLDAEGIEWEVVK